MAPNQNINRFFKNIITNRYSMRSEDLKKGTKVRILGLGDSIINGGQPTDHNDLATTIMDLKIKKDFSGNGEFLNISAGSWGPGNVMAYIKKFGNFGAKSIFWVVSSHDLKDNMTFLPIVGRHKSHPDKNPSIAIWELVNRYFIRQDYKIITPEYTEWLRKYRLSRTKNKVDAPAGKNVHIQELIDYCKRNQIKLIPYLHPELKELETQKYNIDGEEWINIFRTNEIEFINGMNHETKDGYRDNLHLNKLGQKNMAETAYPYLYKSIKKIEN
jgi:lysophospholipase L1-like esterase